MPKDGSAKAPGPLLERCPYCLRHANAEARRTAKRGYALVRGLEPVALPLTRG